MQLGSAGYLTEGEYTGYYSVNEESFLQEKDLVRDEATGCLQTAAGEKVELIREKNYLFMMTEEMREQIKAWVAESVSPETIR